MIPTIEAVVEDLIAGSITKSQAVTWLHQHAEDAHRNLRDDFAAAALNGMCAGVTKFMNGPFLITNFPRELSKLAYAHADCMLAERNK